MSRQPAQSTPPATTTATAAPAPAPAAAQSAAEQANAPAAEMVTIRKDQLEQLLGLAQRMDEMQQQLDAAKRVPPVQITREQAHSADLPIRQLRPIDEGRVEEVIVSTEKVLDLDYAAQLAFNEEPVEILLHRGQEKYAPELYDFSIQGRTWWVRVETRTVVPRKVVEVIARAQPYDVTTETSQIANLDANAPVINRVHRTQRARFAFAVLRDPNPRGAAWLAKVMRES